MTISVTLHNAHRSELNTFTSDDGYKCLKIYAEEFQGSEDRVSIWFPAKLAEEIHDAIEETRKAKFWLAALERAENKAREIQE